MYNIYLSYRIFRRAYNKNKRATLKTLNRVSKLKLNLMKIKVNHDDIIIRRQIRDGVSKYTAINKIMDTERVSIKKARIILKQRDKKARKDFAKLQERMEVWKKNEERVDTKMQEKMKRLEDRWT
tara:strand:+ start:46 stop:420 length:375 start_codon:yes stop_codon:yes gene_type:complete